MPKNSLSRHALIVGFCTLISRVFGFARDMVIAQLFGAGFAVDAFLVANKIPNFMRRLFAEGAFSQAFVPVLAEYQKTKGDNQTKQFINHLCGVLSLVLLIITVIGILAAPIVVVIFAPGFEHGGDRFNLTSQMLVYTFPYLLFISLTAMAGAILNTYDRFAIPAFTPVLLNLSLILCAVYLAPHLPQPVMALAIGILIAGIVQLLFQFPFLSKIHRFPIPKPSLRDPGVRRVMMLMVPALFGVSVGQINVMIDQWFASFLQVGSISWLYYSDRIAELPLGVFGVAIATVILPNLSRKNAVHDHEQYSRIVDWSLRSVLLVGLPSSLGLILLAGPILVCLLNHGAFTQQDVLLSEYCLMAFGLGLPAFMLIKVLASGFYAKQNIKLPVKIAVVALIANTLFSFCFIWSLKHVGLALATAFSALINAGLLFYFLRKKAGYVVQPGWGIYAVRILTALIGMAVYIYLVTPMTVHWFGQSTLWRVNHLSVSVVGALAVYFFILYCTGYRWQRV